MCYVTTCSSPFRLLYPFSLLLLIAVLGISTSGKAQSTRYLLPKVFNEDFASKVNNVANDSPAAIYRTPIRGQFVYGKLARVFGPFKIGRSGIFAEGLVSVEGSLARGKEIRFLDKKIDCRQGKFIVKSSNPSKPVLRINNASVHYALDSQVARVTPVEEVGFLEFPNHHYILGFHEFTWPFTEQDITVKAKLDTLGKPHPIHARSTNPEQKGLAFDGTSFNYRFDEGLIQMGGVSKIRLKDIVVFPKDSVVIILADGSLDTLRDARVEFRAQNEHIKAESRGDITITSRTAYSGVGDYEFINYKGNRLSMKVDVHDTPENRALHSRGGVALLVPDEQPVEVIPGFLFTGRVKLSPESNDFNFAGEVSVNMPSSKDYFWDYVGKGGKGVEMPRNLGWQVTSKHSVFLEKGLSIDREGRLEVLFPQRDTANVFRAQLFNFYGKMRYKVDTGAYQVRHYAGKDKEVRHLQSFEYFPEERQSQFSGLFNLNSNSKNITVRSSAVGTCDLSRQLLQCRAVIEWRFRTNRRAFSVIADAFKGFDPMTYVDDPQPLYRNLRNFLPSEDMDMLEKTYGAKWNLLSYYVNSMVFTDVELHWSGTHQAFYSKGQIAVSNFFKSNVNARLNGFVYIPTKEGQQEMHVYLEGRGGAWYYFKRKKDHIYIHSTNAEVNEYYKDRNRRIKWMPKDEALEMMEFYEKNFDKELPR